MSNSSYPSHASHAHSFRPSTSGCAIASLVLGIVALLISWMPIVNNFSAFIGIIGLVLGIIGIIGIKRGKKSGKGLAIAGLILNILSILIVLATQSMYSSALQEASDKLSTTETLSSVADNSLVQTDDSSMQTTDSSSVNTQSEGAVAANQSLESSNISNVPTEFKSALKRAESYSKTMHMSKRGIYEQLTSDFDKFSAEAAQYAVDNLKADYNANALAKAKSYQKMLSMSPEGIRSQLTSEYGDKFTQEEADYAVANLE